jgi:hypothetical protein
VSVKKRMSDLEKAALIDHGSVPDAERFQVLRPGESMEERKNALVEKYGSTKGIIFVRMKGRDE